VILNDKSDELTQQYLKIVDNFASVSHHPNFSFTVNTAMNVSFMCSYSYSRVTI